MNGNGIQNKETARLTYFAWIIKGERISQDREIHYMQKKKKNCEVHFGVKANQNLEDLKDF